MALFSSPHPFPDMLADLIAARFQLLGEPMRIKLLDRLREEKRPFRSCKAATGSSQQNVSKHLAAC